ncbi:MAG: protein kinase, partial [Planctomycetes bacterium]|nr:protein kinase [Planctomycetota bacterium]
MTMDNAAAQSRHFDFITLAIAHKIITHEQAEEVQEILRKEKAAGLPERAPEAVLRELGVIREEEVWAIYKARERLMRDTNNFNEKIGGYEIISKVGEGGLGVVYKARQLSIGRVVALKVLHEKWMGDDEFRKRFLVEARIVGRLSHPNLIQVIDVGRHRNQLYYSMEFVDGDTVEKIIENSPDG